MELFDTPTQTNKNIKKSKSFKTDKIINQKNNNENIVDNYKKSQELKEIKSFSEIKEKLLDQFNKKTLHHAIMLSGNYGIGKATFAYWLVSNMIIDECKKQNNDENLIKMHINLLEKNIHPDVFFLNIQEGENEIKIDQVREMLNKINLKSTYGNKFVIIDDINSINFNGLNTLLKTLEEPFKNTFFLIIDHQTTRLLDTIYSRCNKIKLSLSSEECMSILQQLHPDWSKEDIKFYANISGNSINFANKLHELDITKSINSITNNQEIANLLNKFSKQIDTKYNNLSRILKISLLEQIIMFFIKRNINSCEVPNEQIIKQNNSLLKQIIDIKSYELPVRFI